MVVAASATSVGDEPGRHHVLRDQAIARSRARILSFKRIVARRRLQHAGQHRGFEHASPRRAGCPKYLRDAASTP